MTDQKSSLENSDMITRRSRVNRDSKINKMSDIIISPIYGKNDASAASVDENFGLLNEESYEF